MNNPELICNNPEVGKVLAEILAGRELIDRQEL